MPTLPTACGAKIPTQRFSDLSKKRFGLKGRHYVLLVSRDENGAVRKVPLPLHYAYIFVAAAVIGTFTMAGLAGSYTRMLVKTASFNKLRDDHDALQKDYAHLEKQEHEKDVQAASLGSLATEVSALYGLTANKLVAPMGHALMSRREAKNAAGAATAVAETASAGLSDESYYKSLDTFYSLRNSALNGAATRAIDGISTLNTLGSVAGAGLDASIGSLDAPSLWPVMGPITSSFGQREDPVLHNGEGEFHAGVDIGAPAGTPVRATADGSVKLAGLANGYGREVIVDHGNGLESCYAHLSGFAVMEGEHVVRGEVIGYVGTSGRTVGGANLHYEIRIHNTPVNPHKYLRETLAGLGGDGLTAAGS
jgi:murein DD-endopeptidase MepM/ murein hydrolase activator NlpD